MAKNTGIKKYNQRYLRELADGKNIPFTVSTEQTYRVNVHSPFVIDSSTPYNVLKGTDDTKSKDYIEKSHKKGLEDLIPGRIYSK